MNTSNIPVHSVNASSAPPVPYHRRWVRETRYGRWFLTTQIWQRYVIQASLDGFSELLGTTLPSGGQLLDLGCGPGAALPCLDEMFSPAKLYAADIDHDVLQKSATVRAAECRCPVELHHASAYELPWPDNSFDLIFCHQLLHHSADQAAVLHEMRRVLKPDGLLLVGESCKVFIRSWWVRLFFSHPMEVQKTAAQYLQLVRNNGFQVCDEQVKISSPWWSRRDSGLGELLGFRPRRGAEATEILLVARKH